MIGHILTLSCPPGETPGESPQQMSDRVDRVIARIREIHAKVSGRSKFKDALYRVWYS